MSQLICRLICKKTDYDIHLIAGPQSQLSQIRISSPGDEMNTFTTATMIEQITLALLGPTPSAKEKFVMKNTLVGLVRLAQSEYRVDVNRSVQRATAMVTMNTARRDAKAAIRKASALETQPELNARDAP
jgi:hypothetical protein